MKFGFLLVPVWLLWVLIGPAQAFNFAPDDAWNIGGEVGMYKQGNSSSLCYQVRSEVPAFGSLRFLGFIPGFGFELGLGLDKSLFFQSAITSRAHLAKPFVIKAGIGLVNVSFENGWYLPVMAGCDLFIKRNLCFTANYSYFAVGNSNLQGNIRVSAGLAVAGRYEN
jgi:hypothetical protein